MKAVGVWDVEKDKVLRIGPASVTLERELEQWIERDPSLLEGGLEVVGRQIRVEAGIIDLLALDLQGRWVVIEIKKGALHREAVAQALDYASCIAKMGFEELASKVNHYLKSAVRKDKTSEKSLKDRIQSEQADNKDREIVVYVVGTGQDPSLERVLDFLGDKSQRVVNAVLFNVFELESGHRILVRELTSNDMAPLSSISSPTRPNVARPNVAEVLKTAERNGLAEAFEPLMAAAERHGFCPRPYKHSIMFAPPNNRGRCLFVAWVEPPANRMVKLYVASEAFQEFYALRKGLATKELGSTGYRQLPVSQVTKFVRSLDRLMSSVGH
jgi:Holliday junction resolvase-like predicted endonuclease